MNILVTMKLKVIPASVFLFGSLDTKNECKEEFDLINFLACGVEDYILINMCIRMNARRTQSL